MAGYTAFKFTNGTYYTVSTSDVTVYGDDKDYFYREANGALAIEEVQIYDDFGKGKIAFKTKDGSAPNELNGDIVAAKLHVANRATDAEFATNSNVLYLSVPIGGGEVGWNFNPGGAATVSLKLKVRVKNLT